MEYDDEYDDYDDRMRKRYRNHLAAHPHPADPDHPDPEDYGLDDEEDE